MEIFLFFPLFYARINVYKKEWEIYRASNKTIKLIAFFFAVVIFSFSLSPLTFAEEKLNQGSIIDINTQETTITINLGSKDDLTIGMPAFILRQAQKLGPFSVISVDKKTAAITKIKIIL